MENEAFDIMALVMEHGPTALGFLLGLVIPADKLPILKKFLGKTSEEIKTDD
jgi:hypothetical protein